MGSSQRLRLILVILFSLLLALVAVLFLIRPAPASLLNPLGNPTPTPTPKPLLKYTFTNLKQTPPQASQLSLDSLLSQTPTYHTWIFSYTTEGKKMTGQLNVPVLATPSAGFPTIVLLRGYVDPAVYTTGMGTKNAAAVFAQNGYATLAPDFLGFGGSDPPAINTLAARLEKPKHVLDLLVSLSTLSFLDSDHLGIWAHSNGGQIALSVLEISGKTIPTTLWAPVSKSFPYSVLYYTDESADQGKDLRQVLADFEANYDVYDFSIDRYFEWLKAPVQIHQGTNDDAVPVEWSQALAKSLEKTNQNITLYIYPGADHNLQPAWNAVIARDLSFFHNHLLN